MSNNLNAPVAVTKAAVLYVFRLLINKDIPLNSGCLDQIEIIIPEGSLLNPSDEAAVVGGNVETSQRITDVLLGALGIAAASQGTMNNFVFGSEDGSGRQYYETIAGGSGATCESNGASAVQVHMTNTRSTDPEILEHRFKEIRLKKFEIRKGSGGKGEFRGGDGVIREIIFLESRKVSILSERRVIAPYGLRGGHEGLHGSNSIRKVSGEEVDLGGKVERIVNPGETIIIKTPGGGGFGSNS
jgi:5-oxoprolinase (ATP-hydrolysing)